MGIWSHKNMKAPPPKSDGIPRSKGWRTPYGFGDFTTPVTYDEACEIMKPIYENFLKQKEETMVDNQHQKIKGYRDLSEEEIALMNEAKELAAKCGELIDRLNNISGLDQRWISIGKTDLQKGFMSVIRGIAQPTTF